MVFAVASSASGTACHPVVPVEHIIVAERKVGTGIAVAIIHISAEVVVVQHVVVDNHVGVVAVVVLDADVTMGNLPLEITIPIV